MIYKINYSNNNLIGGNFFFINPTIINQNEKDNKYHLTFGILNEDKITGHWVNIDGTKNIAYAVFSKDEILIKWNLILDKIYRDDIKEQKKLDQFKDLNLRRLNQKGSEFILSKYNKIITQKAIQVDSL